MAGILGVESLDSALGSVPAGSRILITSAPDVDGRALLLQATRTALRDGHPVVYVTTERPPSAIRRALERSGQSDHEHLHFIDGYSGQLASPDDNPLPKPSDLGALVDHLESLAKEHPDSILCVESISAMASKAEQALLNEGAAILEAMKHYRATIALYVEWPDMPNVERFLKKFDGGLHFYGLEDRIVRNNALKVDFLSWSRDVSTKPHLVTVREDGALRALVPKIAVTGPQDAGKTSFVHSVSEDAVGTERGSTTVALDKGRYRDGDVEAEVFGTPGQKRFDPLINTLLEQAAAVILMVDSADPDSFERADELLERVRRRGLHVVVAATKQDLDGAVDPNALHERFAVPVIPCHADDEKSSKELLTAVLRGILQEASA